MVATDARAQAHGRHDVQRRARGLLLGVALVLGAVARADDRVSAGTFVYTDADHLTVVHPEASAAVDLTQSTKLVGGYEADVVSAATIDVRSSASPRGFHEVRHGANLGATQELERGVALSGRYALSSSPDYLTHAANLGVSVEDDAKQVRLELQLSAARDSIGRVGDSLPVGHATALGSSLGASWLLSRNAVADVAFGVEHQEGYLESPYRFVTIYQSASAGAAAGAQSVSVPEVVPNERLRGSLQPRLRWAITDTWFVRSSLRLHQDNWGVVGQTLELRLSHELARVWLVSLYGRGYRQDAASFYHGRYNAALPSVPTLRTRDRTLAPTQALSAGLHLQWQLGELDGLQLQLEARSELTSQYYDDTPILPQRSSLVLGLNLAAQR